MTTLSCLFGSFDSFSRRADVNIGQLRQPYLAGLSVYLRYVDIGIRDRASSKNIRRGVLSHTRSCSPKVRRALGAAVVILAFPPSYHIPCNRTPPRFFFKPTQLTSNILAICNCKRKLGLLTPRQNLRGSYLFACRSEARAFTSAVVGSYQYHPTLRGKGYTTNSCFQRPLISSSPPPPICTS